MSDRGDEFDDLDEFGELDRDEEEQMFPPARSNEGVRILGSEEAQAVIEGESTKGRVPDDEPKFGDVPPGPDPTIRPAASFPRPQSPAGPESGREPPPVSWSASEEGIAPPPGMVRREGEPSGPVSLPHWSEPPSGEVPVILPEAEITDEDDDDIDAWSAFATGGQPRFRAGAGDWADADFESEGWKDEDTSGYGALAEPIADDDEQFEEQVARRRSRRARAGPRRDAPPSRPALPDEDESEVFDDASSATPDLQVRLITAGIMVVVALVCFWLGRGATALLAAVVVGVAALELFEGLRRRGFAPATVLGLLGSFGIVLVAYDQGTAAYPMMFALVVGFSLLWYLAEVVRGRPVGGLGATLLGFAYVGGLGAFAGLLLAAPDGIGLLLGVALCAIAYDAGGYFVGSQFGKRPLLPRISPGKTVEGLIGGMAAALIVGVLTSTLFGLTPWDGKASYGLWLGIIVAIVAPLGDLCESMIKRDLGVKDLGTVLPGHGGVLDRFDALLVSLPAVYYLVLHLGLS